MGKVIYLHEWKRRARLGGDKPPVLSPRPPRNRAQGGRLSFVSIGDVSDELVRKLTE